MASGLIHSKPSLHPSYVKSVCTSTTVSNKVWKAKQNGVPLRHHNFLDLRLFNCCLERLRRFVDAKLNVEEKVHSYSFKKRTFVLRFKLNLSGVVVASHTQTVGELKLLIFQEMDILPYSQDLWWNGKHLDDDNVRSGFLYNFTRFWCFIGLELV